MQYLIVLLPMSKLTIPFQNYTLYNRVTKIFFQTTVLEIAIIVTCKPSFNCGFDNSKSTYYNLYCNYIISNYLAEIFELR